MTKLQVHNLALQLDYRFNLQQVQNGVENVYNLRLYFMTSLVTTLIYFTIMGVRNTRTLKRSI